MHVVLAMGLYLSQCAEFIPYVVLAGLLDEVVSQHQDETAAGEFSDTLSTEWEGICSKVNVLRTILVRKYGNYFEVASLSGSARSVEFMPPKNVQ